MQTASFSPAIKTARADLANPDVWALLSSEAGWLLDVIENIAEAFVYWGPDDRLVMCNSQYPLQFLEPDKVRPGVHFSELVEQNIRTGRVVRFDDINDVSASPEAYREKRMALHHSGHGSFEVENYSGKWLQAKERKTRDGGTVGIYTDITGIKQAEQREHQAAIAEARANQGKSRFLAAASHDLRQPLHAMGILVSALSGRLESSEERELLSGIDTCLNTMQSLFDSLLDISRLDAGVIEPKLQPLDLSLLLKHVEQEFSPQAQSKGLTLTIRGCGYYSYSDSSMLGRILRNLMANAIKYTDTGRVLVAVRPHMGALALEVWDTGIGFPTEQIDIMLGEFKQLEVGKVRRQGLGLGLSIANRLCNMLQHPMEIRSLVGRGSMFRVIIPLHQQPIQAVEVIPQATEYPDISQYCILVLDDDLDNLKATALLLRDWGCRVDTATNLTEIQQIKCCPDLMLVDHHLSDNEKGCVAIDILSAKFGKKIPGLVITGDTEPEQLQQIKAQGYPVVHKPLKPMKLRALLQQRFR
ncbi:response regulator [Amphritea opalescens]|uniref:histidine kinase n=1 Tax=Amphritea opalescens TaxID=2490544 RepID=A0A430KPB3_9GAMM|nr:ATP-binding protein [Amphritea opalescens]RTE65337.1 response regulator [Amphritea opalescens]